MLIVAATCAPADIRYPIYLSIQNEAREKAEEIIDMPFSPDVGKMKEPGTYRKKARKQFVETNVSDAGYPYRKLPNITQRFSF
jgi:hypothetical protein